MTDLADLDHPGTPYPFEPWGRDVYLRKIGATTLLRLKRDYAELQDTEADTSTEAMKDFYAELLADTVVDPQAPKQAWQDVHLPNLIALGKLSLEHSNLVAQDDDDPDKENPDGNRRESQD